MIALQFLMVPPPPPVTIWLLRKLVNDTSTDVLRGMPTNGSLACFTVLLGVMVERRALKLD